MFLSSSIAFVVPIFLVVQADIKIAKKSPNYNVGTNDDVQNEHFQFNYKSKTPEHTISREINDERVYKMPYSGYQNGIYDNMNKVDIIGPEYATNVPKFYLKYNPEPIQSEQHLMNLHYHNNFEQKIPQNREDMYPGQLLLAHQNKLKLQKQQQQQQRIQQQKQPKHLLKLFIMNMPQAMQLLHTPTQSNNYQSDQAGQLQTNNYVTSDRGKPEAGGLQYNMMHLKLENIPPYGQVAHGEVNSNGIKKFFIMANENRGIIKRDENTETDESLTSQDNQNYTDDILD